MFPKPEFYGSATVGERGQVVLPASARKRLGLAKGDKMLVVFYVGGTTIRGAIYDFALVEE